MAVEPIKTDTFPGLDTLITTGHTETEDKEKEKEKEKDEGEEKAHYEYWVPYGTMSFTDLDILKVAAETASDMRTLTHQYTSMIENIMGSDDLDLDKPRALKNLGFEFEARTRAVLATKTLVGKVKAAAQKILSTVSPPAPSPAPEMVWKDATTGQYRWLVSYSNNFRDDDAIPEIIAAESHQYFAKQLDEGTWPMPELWMFHVDYKVGTTTLHEFNKETGFVVAGGHFDEGMDWVAEALIGSVTWKGVSHGMPIESIVRSKEDSTIIIQHRTKEISILPTVSAANKLAFNIIKETAMSEENAEKGLGSKRAAFVDEFDETFVQRLEQGLDAAQAKAAKDQTESKEVTTPPAAAITDAAEALATVAKAAPAAGTEEAPSVSKDELLEVLKNLNERLSLIEVAVKEQAAQPPEVEQSLMELLKMNSTSNDTAAKVDMRKTAQKDSPEEEPANEQGKGFYGLFQSAVDANSKALTQ